MNFKFIWYIQLIIIHHHRLRRIPTSRYNRATHHGTSHHLHPHLATRCTVRQWRHLMPRPSDSEMAFLFQVHSAGLSPRRSCIVGSSSPLILVEFRIGEWFQSGSCQSLSLCPPTKYPTSYQVVYQCKPVSAACLLDWHCPLHHRSLLAQMFCQKALASRYQFSCPCHPMVCIQMFAMFRSVETVLIIYFQYLY